MQNPGLQALQSVGHAAMPFANQWFVVESCRWVTKQHFVRVRRSLQLYATPLRQSIRSAEGASVTLQTMLMKTRPLSLLGVYCLLCAVALAGSTATTNDVFLLCCLQSMLMKPKPLTLQGVYASLRTIALTKGAGSAQRKQDLIKQLISRCR